MKPFENEKTAEATNEILINEAEFDAAFFKAVAEVMGESELIGRSGFEVMMTGTLFVCHMKKFLFGKEEEK